MNTRSIRLALAVGLVAALAGPARAQGPGSWGFLGGGPFMLMAPNFQRELKLTGGQLEKVNPTLRDLAVANRETLAGFRNLDPRERLPRQRAMVKRLNGEVKATLGFTPEQSKRFDQVSLRQRRFDAFGDPEVQDALKLTAEQKQKIAQIARASRERTQVIVQKVLEGDLQAAKRLAALSQKMAARAAALLDGDQQKVWKAMTGEPIEVKLDTRAKF